MNNAIINVKVDTQTKEEAQKVAQEMGLSLSSVIKVKLREFIRDKSLHVEVPEIPNEKTKEAIRLARKQRVEGKASPVFDTAEESLKYLEEQGI